MTYFTWNELKKLSSSLVEVLQNIINQYNYANIEQEDLIIIINESKKIKNIINNYTQAKSPNTEITKLVIKEIRNKIKQKLYEGNYIIIDNYLQLHKKDIKINKYNLDNLLTDFFQEFNFEPDLEQLLVIYDSIPFIQLIITAIIKEKHNLDLFLDDTGEILRSFVEIYHLKNNTSLFDPNNNNPDIEFVENKPSRNDKYSTYQIDFARQIIAESKQYAVLDQDEIRALIFKAQNGSKYAEEKIIKHNQRLVIKILNKYLRNNLDFLDLYQEGCMGLSKAIHRFDLSKNFQFSTYATWWIRQFITRYIADNERTIRIPVHMHEKLSKFKRVQEQLFNELGRKPTIQELAKKMNCSPEQILELYKSNHDTVSIHAKIGEDEESELLEVLKDDTIFEDSFFEKDFNQKLEAFLKSLNLKERLYYVALHRLDMFGRERMTLDAISKKFGVTRECIRLDENKVKKAIFFAPNIKDFCNLFPNPEAIYKNVLEYRNKFYNKTTFTNAKNLEKNLAERLNITLEEMHGLILRLNERDQKFILSHYDETFNNKQEVWQDEEIKELESILYKLRRLIKNPEAKVRKNKYTNLSSLTKISPVILRMLIMKFSVADQNFIFNLYNDNFELNFISINTKMAHNLEKILTKLELMKTNPLYDPKQEENLCNILETHIDGLNSVVALLSPNLQRFLAKKYDEYWNEKEYTHSKEEKKLLNKIVLVLRRLLAKKELTQSGFDNLNQLESLIVMGLISNNNFDTAFIAEFLKIDENLIIEKIRNALVDSQNKNHELILIRNKKNES